MTSKISEFIKSDRFHVLALALLGSLIVGKLAFPYINYFLGSLIIVYSVAFVFTFSNDFFSKTILFLNKVWFILIPLAFYYLSVIRTTVFSTFLLKESIYIFLVLLLSFYYFVVNDRNNKNADNIKNKFINIYVSVVSVIAILSIIKFIFFLSGVRIPILLSEGIRLYGTSIAKDYNFYSLGILIALYLVIFSDSVKLNKHLIVFSVIALSLSIAFGLSRRGLFFLFLFFSAIVGFRLKRKKALNLAAKTYASVFVIIIISSGFLFLLPDSMLYSLTKNTGLSFKKIDVYKRTLLYRFSRDEKTGFLPVNPVTWPNKRIYKLQRPLEGNNLAIVPKDALGYLMDNTCNATVWKGNARSFTLLNTDSVGHGDQIEFSAFAFVSEDFDGSFVRLTIEGVERRSAYYDMMKKGTWQKLSISVASDSVGKINSYLYWGKNDASNFKSLTGYVTYAYPIFKIKRENQLSISKYSDDDFDFSLSAIAKHNNRFGRWAYSLMLFKDYSLSEKLIGTNLDYLRLFPKKFQVKSEDILNDYPHNFLLSALLYSGIIGVIFLFYAICFIFIAFIKYDISFLPIYIMIFTFCFVSGNAFFSIPAFFFFSLWPFVLSK